MIDDLKPYQEYKELGLPWVGQIPSHWEIRPTSGAFAPINSKNVGMKEKVVLSLSYGRVVIKPPEKLHGLVPESFETYQILVPGDIVLRTVDLQNDHTSLRVGFAKNQGIITSAYLALRVKSGLSPEFGFHFLQAWDASKAIYGYGSGLRQNLDFSHFKRMPIPVPPAEEQAAIVRFVGHLNRCVDQAIRSKRKLIALLNEQKQAIIHNAVTRGLDPNAPLKDSAIPWLGQIPSHWEIIRGDHLFATSKQLALPEDIQLSATQAYGVISQEDYEARIGRRIVKINMHLEKRKHVEKDDFVMSMRSFQGGLERAWQSGAIRSSYVILRPSSKVEPSYFMYLLKSPGYIRALQSTGNFIRDGQDLTEDNFRAVPLPIFSKEEQREIGGFIKSQTEGITKQVQIEEREIDLLREYRTRLVSDVVTGKLDVRAAAAKLPPEVEESDSVTETEDLDGLDDEVVEEAA